MRTACLLWLALGCSAPDTGHFEYVFPDGEIDVFDIDHGHERIKTISVPEATIIRGVAAHAASHMLYIGGNGATPADSYVLKFDLIAGRVIWKKLYPPMVDGLCVTPDGKRLYVPHAEDEVLALDTADGAILATIAATSGVHNTVCTPDGQRVYVGAQGSTMMTVIATADDTVVRRLGPFGGFVRPFIIDVDERFVFANVNGLLGFEVADAQTGTVRHRVSPGAAFPFTAKPDYTPSHGIAASPDGREVWVIDQPFNQLHVFDVRGLPEEAPKPIANIALRGSLSAPGPPQGREGWLQFSRDGRYVYVGDAGDVVEAATRRIVAHLDALSKTRKFLEIDFDHGVPEWASPRTGPSAHLSNGR